MCKKYIVLCYTVISIVGVSTMIASSQEIKEPVSEEESYEENFEEMFAPYQEVLDDFNASHGTTYALLTDEQLEQQNKSRQEYYEDMIKKYSNITPEEFKNNLENAYENDMLLSSQSSDNVS